MRGSLVGIMRGRVEIEGGIGTIVRECSIQ